MKSVLILLTGLLLFSCATMKEKKQHIDDMHLSDTEMARFYHANDTIYRDSIPVGYVQSTEWEYTVEDGMRLEISIMELDPYNDNALDIIKYIHTRHNDAKIEVNHDLYYQKKRNGQEEEVESR